MFSSLVRRQVSDGSTNDNSRNIVDTITSNFLERIKQKIYAQMKSARLKLQLLYGRYINACNNLAAASHLVTTAIVSCLLYLGYLLTT